MKPIMVILLLLWVGPLIGMTPPAFKGRPTGAIEAGGISVDILPTLEWSTGKGPVPLHLLGAGVREKKVLFLSVDVYVAAHYTDVVPEAITERSALDRLDRIVRKAMHLTFVRAVKANQIREAFEEAMVKNDIDIKQPPIQAVLGRMTTDFLEGDTLTLLSERLKGGVDKVSFHTKGVNFETVGVGLASSFWRMWFGKPVDHGVDDLRPKLLGLSQTLVE